MRASVKTHLTLITLLLLVMVGVAEANITEWPLPVWYKAGVDSSWAVDNRPSGDPDDSRSWNGWTLWQSTTKWTVANGGTICFAMNNLFNPTMHKVGAFNLTTSTARFFGDDAGNWNPNVLLDVKCAYDTDDYAGYTGPDPVPHQVSFSKTSSKATTEFPIMAGGVMASIQFGMDPQPSWEWVCVTNNTGSSATFAGASGWSACTPEPSLGLLLLVGMIPVAIGFRRRRRA